MPKLINIEDVSLKSMSVEIRALTVSGKQMTLSVFRQLPEKSILDDQLNLIGIPWGRVLYFWGAEKDCKGFQVVWQSRDTLFRSVQHPPNIRLVKTEALIALERKAWESRSKGLSEEEKQLLEIETVENEKRLAKYRKIYEDLENLPQLFIAM